MFLGKECKDDYSKKIILVYEYNTKKKKKSFSFDEHRSQLIDLLE